MSPAIPLSYYNNYRSDLYFSPLTSPALGPQQQSYQIKNYSTAATTDPMIGDKTTTPQDGQSPEELREQLAMIERQQQQLRSRLSQSSSSPSTPSSPAIVASSPLSPVHRSVTPSSIINASSTITKPKQTLRHKIAMSSPQFNPTTHLRSPGIHPSYSNNITGKQQQNQPIPNSKNHTIAPATPSLLMKLGTGKQHSIDTINTTPSNDNSPAALSPMTPSHDSIIDSMMSLPDAMLPPSTTRSTHSAKQTIYGMDSTTFPAKRQRISYPRAAFTPPALLPSYHHQQHQHSGNDTAAIFDQGIAALISPTALRPHMPSTATANASPRALKPLISPSLQPNSSMDEHRAASILASKSNYQTLREGQAKSLGIDFNTTIQSGMENRRSAHKAAEQRRRDTLKQNFDALRMELLEALVAEDDAQRLEEEEEQEGDNKVTTTSLEREKKVKQMSKVVLLQHSYEYILRLKYDRKHKDTKLDCMADEIKRLRSQLGLPSVTEEEQQEEAEEKLLERERRLAWLKRFEDVVDS